MWPIAFASPTVLGRFVYGGKRALVYLSIRVNIPIKQTTSVNMCCGHAYTIPMITYVRHWSSHIWTGGCCATCPMPMLMRFLPLLVILNSIRLINFIPICFG